VKQAIVVIIFLILISSCSDDDSILIPGTQNVYKEIAYNSLSDKDKETLTDYWTDAKVYEGTLHSDGNSAYMELSSGQRVYIILNLDGYKITVGKKIVGVSFNTRYDALLGPITIIVDPDLKIAIGGVERM